MPTDTRITSIPSISVDGAAAPAALNLSVLRVRGTVGAAAHAHLRYDGADEAAGTFGVGKAVTIDAIGEDGAPQPLFSGEIVSVGLDWDRGRDELVVDAYDLSYRLAQRTVVKSFKDMSAGDVVSQLAQECGLAVDVCDEMRQIRYPSTQQWGTAHRCVTDLCHTAGCEWWMDGNTLVVRRRSAAGSPTVQLSGSEHLHRFTARFSAMEQAAKVKVRGWDPKEKRAITAEAPGVNGGAPSSAPIVTTAVDAQHEATSWPRHVVSTADDASTIAGGIAQRMGAAVLGARGECDVDAAIRPGTVVTIANVSTRWNGDYYVSSVEHVFGRDQPFVTRFTAGAADDGSLVELIGAHDGPTSARFTGGLTIGLVTNNNDTEGKQNRVKLKLPYLSDTDETEWARIVQPGAGASRGLLMLPEVGDEVLVGFEHGDVRRPYVLGGLWNGVDAPPLKNDQAELLSGSSVVSRSLTSRKGHRITLVDGAQGADDRIDATVAAGGGKVELWLGAEEVRLAHAGDYPLKIATARASVAIAAGGDITIKGNSITLDADTDVTIKAKGNVKTQGVNVETSANASLKLKGTASVGIEASGMTEIKGAMVKVN